MSPPLVRFLAHAFVIVGKCQLGKRVNQTNIRALRNMVSSVLIYLRKSATASTDRGNGNEMYGMR